VTARAPPEVAAKVKHRRGVGVEVDATCIEPVGRIQRRHALPPPDDTHTEALIRETHLRPWPRLLHSRGLNTLELVR
jgi:hypothetical protein